MEKPNVHAEPMLPAELEQEIFEIVVFQRPIRKFKQLLTLMLVARRVHDWIKPFLYKVVINSQLLGPQNPAYYPPAGLIHGGYPAVPRYSQFGKYVRHLMMDCSYAHEALDILQYCPNIQNIALWEVDLTRRQEFLNFIQFMPIQRLSADLELLFQTPPYAARKFAIDHTIFSHLTHLEVVDIQSTSWKDWQPLSLIPKLSHLVINECAAKIALQVLKHSHSLQLLILFLDDMWEQNDHSWLEGGFDDERAVILFKYESGISRLGDWEQGAHGLPDFWTLGEVQKQKRVGIAEQFQLLTAKHAYEDSEED